MYNNLLQNTIFTIGSVEVNLATVALVALVLALTWWAGVVLERAIEATLRRGSTHDAGTIRAVSRLAHYAVLLVGGATALDLAGFDFGAIMAASAVFAVGIGFALQNLAQNFVSGVLLLVEQSIKPGDILEVDGRVVRVMQMRLRTTVARTRDEEDLIIPNASLVQGTVKNHTLTDATFRLRATIGVSYRSDMRQVREILERVARDAPFRAPNHEFVVLMTSFGDSAVTWEVGVWTEESWAAHRHVAALNESIWFAFQEAGIEIPFPQLDVHLWSHPVLPSAA
ncbi:MAG TPA: mechanosensitive ion channel [Myxococcota bacterium]|nr:mechanosensitive ion channel [Myxococcota bacterium]